MKAWELLDHESKWTQAGMAEDEIGNPVDPHSPLAVRRCAAGAIFYCYEEDWKERLHQFAEWLRVHYDDYPWASDEDAITAFNDEEDYEYVHRTLKELDI